MGETGITDLYLIVRDTCKERGVLNSERPVPEYIFLGYYREDHNPKDSLFKIVLESIVHKHSSQEETQQFKLRYWERPDLSLGFAEIWSPDGDIKIMESPGINGAVHDTTKRHRTGLFVYHDISLEAQNIYKKVDHLTKRWLEMLILKQKFSQ